MITIIVPALVADLAPLQKSWCIYTIKYDTLLCALIRSILKGDKPPATCNDQSIALRQSTGNCVTFALNQILLFFAISYSSLCPEQLSLRGESATTHGLLLDILFGVDLAHVNESGVPEAIYH